MRSGVSVRLSNNSGLCGLIGIVFGFFSPVAAAELVVTQAWVKLAPPSSSVNAVYMQLSNEQLQTQVITSVGADCCVMAMLHKTRYEQDKVYMDHLENLSVSAGETVRLQPAGLHIMLMKPQKPLLVDDVVVLMLTFADNTEQKIPVTVKRDAD